MARTAHSATMLGSRLVVVGGVHGNGSLSSDVLVLHTDRRQVGICWSVMTADAGHASISWWHSRFLCSTLMCIMARALIKSAAWVQQARTATAAVPSAIM